MKTSSLLDTSIKLWENMLNVHISIHDLTGILQTPSLQINRSNTIHATPMCDCAKTTSRGMRCCFFFKRKAIEKALSSKESFMGKCYMGTNEMVWPVYYKDHPLCVILIGNFIFEDEIGEYHDGFRRISYATKVEMQKMENLADTVCVLKRERYEDIIKAAQYISDIIKLVAYDQKKHSKHPSTQLHYIQSRHWLITTAITYITTYYDRDLSLTHIAQLYNINSDYFCKLFKRETGTTFVKYLNWVRIDNACIKLKMTDIPIIDIAYSVGFNNVTYFNRVFQKQMGITPTAYRKRYEEDYQ